MNDPSIDRTIFRAIARDRKKFLRLFGIEDVPATKVGMRNIRLLDLALESPYRAATNLIGRFAAGLESSHPLFLASGCSDLTGAEKKKLDSFRLPLATQLFALNLSNELSKRLTSNPELVRSAVLNLTAEVDWELPELLIVESALGIACWPATPESWRQWKLFIVSDPVLNILLWKQAKRYANDKRKTPTPDLAMADLVGATQEDLYLSGINSSDSRRLNKEAYDVRAEILGLPLQKSMQRVLDRQTKSSNSTKELAEYSISTPNSAVNADLEVQELLNSSSLSDLERYVLRLKFHLHDFDGSHRHLANEEIALLLQDLGTTLLEVIEQADVAFSRFIEEIPKEKVQDANLTSDTPSRELDLKELLGEAQFLARIRPRDVQKIAEDCAKKMGLRRSSKRIQ